MNVVCMPCLILFSTMLSAQHVPGSSYASFTAGTAPTTNQKRLSKLFAHTLNFSPATYVKAVAGGLSLIVKPDPEPDKVSFFGRTSLILSRLGFPPLCRFGERYCR